MRYSKSDLFTINEVIEKVKTVTSTPLINELITVFDSGQFRFNDGIRQETQKLASLYKLRQRRHIDLKTGVYSLKELETWNKAVYKLRDQKCDSAILNIIHTDDNSYWIFWNGESREFVSIFSLKKQAQSSSPT